PTALPGASFRIRAAPGKLVKRLHPMTLRVFGAHKAGAGIPEPAVILGARHECLVIFRLVLLPGDLRHTPVIVGIVEARGNGIGARPIRDVTQFEIITQAPSDQFTMGGRLKSAFPQRGISLRHVKTLVALDDGIRKNRGAVLSDHAIAITRAGPFRQGPALLRSLDKSLKYFVELSRVKNRD